MGSRKCFRRYLSAMSSVDSSVRDMLIERVDAEYRELGALGKTIDTLRWYATFESFDEVQVGKVRNILRKYVQRQLDVTVPIVESLDPAFCRHLGERLKK